MIKLIKNQLLASGFVKIVTDIVLILKKLTFIFWIYDTIFFSLQTQLRTAVSPSTVMRFLWIYDKDTVKPCGSA